MTAHDLKRTAEGWRVRLRHGGGKRAYFLIPAPVDETDVARAQAIAEALQRMATRLSAAGRPADEIREYLEDAAGESLERSAFAKYERRAASLPTTKAPDKTPLFREVAESWVSGDLHKRYPDDVGPLKPKTYAKYQSVLVLLNRLLGDKPVDVITLEDAEKAKTAIPEGRTQSTRRAYALVIRKVLSLSEYPLNLIAKSPIPKRFVPPQGKSPIFGFLYPREEEQLLRHMVSIRHDNDEAFDDAAVYGVLHREGMRASEAAMLTVGGIDCESGEITLDENKTDDPRTWAMGHDVAMALKVYVGDRGPDDLVFPDFVMRHAASKFRAYIQAAGITRRELAAGVNRRAIRLHDTRASFITTALAIGMTETWVMDRTGHHSSDMVNKYRRQMRHVKTLGLSWFAPLHECLGYGTTPTLARGPRVAYSLMMQPNLAGREMVAENPQFTAQGAERPPEAHFEPGSGVTAHPGEPTRPAEKQGVAPEGSQAAHGQTPAGEVLPEPTDSPVERALAAGLTVALAAEQWELAQTLVQELGERRRARTAPSVPSLSDARRKREEKP